MYERQGLYIGGRWVAPADGGVLDVISPSTEEVIGHAPLASAADVDGAVAAAREAFDVGAMAAHLARGQRRGTGVHGGLPDRASATSGGVEH